MQMCGCYVYWYIKKPLYEKKNAHILFNAFTRLEYPFLSMVFSKEDLHAKECKQCVSHRERSSCLTFALFICIIPHHVIMPYKV